MPTDTLKKVHLNLIKEHITQHTLICSSRSASVTLYTSSAARESTANGCRSPNCRGKIYFRKCRAFSGCFRVLAPVSAAEGAGNKASSLLRTSKPRRLRADQRIVLKCSLRWSGRPNAIRSVCRIRLGRLKKSFARGIDMSAGVRLTSH